VATCKGIANAQSFSSIKELLLNSGFCIVLIQIFELHDRPLHYNIDMAKTKKKRNKMKNQIANDSRSID